MFVDVILHPVSCNFAVRLQDLWISGHAVHDVCVLEEPVYGYHGVFVENVDQLVTQHEDELLHAYSLVHIDAIFLHFEHERVITDVLPKADVNHVAR